MTDNLERILCIDDEFGEVKAGEIAFFRGGEYATTMAPPNIEQELEGFLAAVDRVLEKRSRQGIRYTRRWQQNGMNIFVVIHAVPNEEQMPEEPSLPPAPLPPRPDFTNPRRMAKRVYEKALLFWWPDPAPGIIYILWLDNFTWESLRDESPPDQAGFDWLYEHLDLGEPIGPERHGGGQILPVAEGAWLKSPISGQIYFLWSNGEWQDAN